MFFSSEVAYYKEKLKNSNKDIALVGQKMFNHPQ